MVDLPDPDRVLASAARFLIEGGEEDLASILLSCSIAIWESGDTWYVGDETHFALHITITGPRAAYDLFTDDRSEQGDAIRRALRAVLPPDTYIKHLTPQAELIAIDADWRQELLEIARGRNVTNQALADRSLRLRVWENLAFRSASEIRIAKVLDQRGVLFFPLCKGRLNTPAGRGNREPDFLVCSQGKWGILEVDGEPFHPPSRTVIDHQRDRLFHDHGIRVIQHYDATECYESPDKVVDGFLGLLAKL